MRAAESWGRVHERGESQCHSRSLEASRAAPAGHLLGRQAAQTPPLRAEWLILREA